MSGKHGKKRSDLLTHGLEFHLGVLKRRNLPLYLYFIVFMFPISTPYINIYTYDVNKHAVRWKRAQANYFIFYSLFEHLESVSLVFLYSDKD